jgi:hypothetical protein
VLLAAITVGGAELGDNSKIGILKTSLSNSGLQDAITKLDEAVETSEEEADLRQKKQRLIEQAKDGILKVANSDFQIQQHDQSMISAAADELFASSNVLQDEREKLLDTAKRLKHTSVDKASDKGGEPSPADDETTESDDDDTDEDIKDKKRKLEAKEQEVDELPESTQKQKAIEKIDKAHDKTDEAAQASSEVEHLANEQERLVNKARDVSEMPEGSTKERKKRQLIHDAEKLDDEMQKAEEDKSELKKEASEAIDDAEEEAEKAKDVATSEPRPADDDTDQDTKESELEEKERLLEKKDGEVVKLPESIEKQNAKKKIDEAHNMLIAAKVEDSKLQKLKDTENKLVDEAHDVSSMPEGHDKEKKIDGLLDEAKSLDEKINAAESKKTELKKDVTKATDDAVEQVEKAKLEPKLKLSLSDMQKKVETMAKEVQPLAENDDKKKVRAEIINAAQSIDSAADAEGSLQELQKKEAAVLESAKQVQVMPSGPERDAKRLEVVKAAEQVDQERHEAIEKRDEEIQIANKATQAAEVKVSALKTPTAKAEGTSATTLQPGLEHLKTKVIDKAAEVQSLPETNAKDAASDQIVDAAQKIAKAHTAMEDTKKLDTKKAEVVNEAKAVSSLPEGVDKEVKKSQVLQKAREFDSEKAATEKNAQDSVKTAEEASEAAIKKADAVKSESAEAAIEKADSTGATQVTTQTSSRLVAEAEVEFKAAQNKMIRKAEETQSLPEGDAKEQAKESLISAAKELDVAGSAMKDLEKIKKEEAETMNKEQSLQNMPDGEDKDAEQQKILTKAKELDVREQDAVDNLEKAHLQTTKLMDKADEKVEVAKKASPTK